MMKKIFYIIFVLSVNISLLNSQTFFYGKNKIISKKFNWKSYTTEHFNIYFYKDDIEYLKHIITLSEKAYDKISSMLKHPIEEKIPIIFYEDHDDFEQTNLFPGIVPEEVMAFAEPVLHRIVLPGNFSPDELDNLITHELAHIFEYSILYKDISGSVYDLNAPPLWVMEGFAEYTTESWDPISFMIVKDSVLNDKIPELNNNGEMSGAYTFARAPYDYGHLIFEFLEHKQGKMGIRQFWWQMKKSSILGKKIHFRETFKIEPKEFNYELKKWVREKFKPYLSKENPEDYSRQYSPDMPFSHVFSHEISPSGETAAIISAHMLDEDLDILIVSLLDGKVLKNLTRGYSSRYEYVKVNFDPSQGKSISWNSKGDALAFFARKGQKTYLFLIKALTGEEIDRISLPIVQPSSPSFSPDSKKIIFTGFKNGTPDIFLLNLENKNLENLTNDNLFEKSPSFSPDGKKVTYSIKVDGKDKIFISDFDNFSIKTQLTFLKGNDINPYFSKDSKEIFFSSDEKGAFNLYSINLETGELKRYTDVSTGNFYPTPFPDKPRKILFSSFYKGKFNLYQKEFSTPLEVFHSTPTKVAVEELKTKIEFKEIPIDEKKIVPYKGIGKLYLMARPPVNVGLFDDGTILGGTSIALSDIFADHQFFLDAISLRDFRSYFLGYINLKNRLQYMVRGFDFAVFYYPDYYYFAPELQPYYSPRDAMAIREILGLDVIGMYPMSKFERIEFSLGFYRYKEKFRYFTFDRPVFPFLIGNMLITSFSLVGETTRFKYFGPLYGSTHRFSVSQTLPIKNFLSSTTYETEFRKYFKVGSETLFAFRSYGFLSTGKDPLLNYFGGINEIRSIDYASMVGNRGFFMNFEFRFPIVKALVTSMGNFGPIRGTFFFDWGGAQLKGWPFKLLSKEGGLHMVDTIGSYGWGIQLFILGYPLHIDFVKPTDLQWSGKRRVMVWIGYDF
ncbi:MAG: hypothetical protein AB1410_04635 [Acidobacteriota bacterium]